MKKFRGVAAVNLHKKKVTNNLIRSNHLRPARIPGLLKAEIFISVKKPESAALNAYIYSMLNFLKSVTFFEIFFYFFCSPSYTKPSVQSAVPCGGYAGFQPHHQPCRKFLAAKHEENLSVRVSATPIFPAIR